MKHNKDTQKHYDNVVAAQEYFSNLKDSKQELFDGKSERWQESDAGMQAAEDISNMETATETLQSAIDEMDIIFDA